jgi:steroid delta-isomerase-like uncharacterized protein
MQGPLSSPRTAQADGFCPDSHEAVMRRFISDVINSGDHSALGDLVHADYVHRAPGRELHGAQGLQALVETYRKAFPDLHIAIDDLLAVGDRCAMAFTLSGTHAGTLMGIDATGKRVMVNGVVFSRFQSGRIVAEWEVLDQLALLEQLGSDRLPF